MTLQYDPAVALVPVVPVVPVVAVVAQSVMTREVWSCE